MRELFIYWRTAAATALAAERAAEDWQRALRHAHPQLRASLYRRADEAGPWVTLMEVYAPARVGLGETLGELVETRIVNEGSQLLARWIEGQRKVEVFERRAGP
jgi:hypothetical protein